MYKVVEGLVPALPTEDFIKFNRPGRTIRSRNRTDYIVNNPVNNYIRNNSKSIKIRDSKTTQYKNSFFIRTSIEWNQLNEDTVQAKSIDSFRSKIQKNLSLD